MKRYLHDFDTARLPRECTDTLVVGAGIAGLWTALHLSPEKHCKVIFKYDTESSNSWLAQGGIAAVTQPDDCFASHIEDTLTAGAGLCNKKTVGILVREAPENIRQLMALRVPFDRDEKGNLQIGREGGHSCRRILHSGGDATGRAIVKALLTEAKKRSNIELCGQTLLVDILTDENGVYGALLSFNGKLFIVETPNVVLATGGIGHLYRYTTNPRGAVGDGIAAAVRAGAETDMMEMIQFHPTTLYSGQSEERLFLISEAVRGEGAILRNGMGEAFMQHVHKMADLAPRDIVTRGILQELQLTGESFARLDVSSMSRAFFAGRFPTIFEKCESIGLHLTDTPIPVHPAQHYFMGGLKVNENAKTGIDGLWAVGECACNGLHGGNRLASNSMLECLVYGRRAAMTVEAEKRTVKTFTDISYRDKGNTADVATVTQITEELRNLMDTSVGAVRRMTELHAALERIDEMKAYLEGFSLQSTEAAELYSMLMVANLVVTSAEKRTESAGAHYLVR